MLNIAGQSVSIPELVALGLGVGYIAGMYGVGGGFMLTPMLNIVFGIPFPIAVGSGLCQMIGTAVTAYRKHRRLGNGEPKFDLLMLGGAIVGVYAGTRLLVSLNRLASLDLWGHTLPAAKFILEALYIVLLTTVALQFIWKNIRTSRREASESLPTGPGPLARFGLPPFVDLPNAGLQRVSLPGIVYTGFGVGVLSGLMGIGGGVALMPILVYGLGFSVHMAAGTGILALVVTASIGTVAHALHGHIHIGLVMTLMFGSTVGAQFGAITAHRLSAERLWGGFVGVILLTVAALVWDVARMFIG